MRCFIGVPLPENVRKTLVKAEDGFRNVDARMTLVEEQNLHVTLAFLDEVENVDKITELLGNVKFASFRASLKNLSFFPPHDYIRVIHAPVDKGRGQFISLYNQIIQALAINPEEGFTPHVTLARVKFVKSTNMLSRACYDIKFEEEFNVDSFNLYTSKLTPNGPVYTILKSFKAVQ